MAFRYHVKWISRLRNGVSELKSCISRPRNEDLISKSGFRVREMALLIRKVGFLAREMVLLNWKVGFRAREVVF